MHDQLIEIVFKNISTENIGYILKDLTSDGQEVVSCNITSDELEIDWNDESSIRRMFQNNTGFGVFINIKELNGKFICLPKCGIAVYKNGDSIDLEINFQLSDLMNVPLRDLTKKLMELAKFLSDKYDIDSYFCGLEPANEVNNRLFTNEQPGPFFV